MRLFIAINFTSKINNHLSQIINDLKRESKRGNFTRTENLHLTLAFLGELAPERIFTITEVMNQCVAGKSPFSIKIGGLGKFTTRGEFLYWCGILKNRKLEELQHDLTTGLMKEAFLVDCKPFQPHITLGRRCIMNQSFKELEFAEKIAYETMTVNSIDLMLSEQKQGKLVYTKIDEVELTD